MKSILFFLTAFPVASWISTDCLGNHNPASGRYIDAHPYVWAERNRIYNDFVTEDRFISSNGDYIKPNEPSQAQVLPCIKNNKGVLISVGTFRALNLGALADFEEIFQLDYANAECAFNYVNKALSRISNNRFEYLSYLYTGQLDKKCLSLRSETDFSDEKLVDCLEAKAGFKSGRGSKPWNQYFSNLRRLHLHLPTIDADYAKKMSQRTAIGSPAPGDALELLERADGLKDLSLKLYFQSKEWPKTFMGNDIFFERIKKKEKEGKIHVIMGDLTGNNALRTLSIALEHAKKEVAAVDISNTTTSVLGSQTERSFLENSKLLPWSKDARLLCTGFGSLSWGYTAIDPMHLPEVEDWVKLVQKLESEKNLKGGALDTPKLIQLFTRKDSRGQLYKNGLSSYPKGLCD